MAHAHLPVSLRGTLSQLPSRAGLSDARMHGRTEGGGGKSGPGPGHCGAAVSALITPDLAEDQLALLSGAEEETVGLPRQLPCSQAPGERVCVRVFACVCTRTCTYGLQPRRSPLSFPGWSWPWGLWGGGDC